MIVSPATEHPAAPLLICFAGDRWDGNPHSRHHLMRRFSVEFEVLFIESLPMRSLARTERHELRRVLDKLHGGMGLRTVAPGLHVLRPPPIPPAGRGGRWAQLAAVRAQITSARRRLRLAGPAVTWFSVPIAAPLLGRLGERGSLFYYQDRYDEFSHVDTPRLRSLISDLAVGCDVCIATSEELAQDLSALGAEVMVVPHGVDVERFAVELPVPDDLVGLERPFVGHVGLLDDHLSFETIRAVADRLDRGTVVMVGSANTDVSALQHPRIALLGFRPYESMPAYLSAFDCCILPFRMNRLTAAVNPIKLREYLAAGRPTVSVPLPAVTEYADVVELARSPTAFAASVARLLGPGNDTPAARERRRERVRGASWDNVAAQILPTLRSLVSARGESGTSRPPSRPSAQHLTASTPHRDRDAAERSGYRRIRPW
jgi:glycosyltransferase involved in cell wall biosynthesis